MTPRPPSVAYGAALLAALVLAGVLFLPGLGWQCPSERRYRLLFPDETRRAVAVERLAHSPRPGEEGWIAFNIARRAAEADARAAGRLPAEGSFADAVLRGLCLASGSFEEPLVLAALASLCPAEGNFDPRLYQYGGFFLYATAAWLKAADVAGFVRLVPDVRYYLARPEEMARLYAAGRLLCALMGFLAVIATFQLAARQFGGAAGAAAAILAALSPLLVAHAHLLRVHLFALPWALWALLWMIRFAEQGGRRAAAAAGFFAGLAAGAAPYHGLLLAPLAVAHLSRPRAEERGRRSALSAAALAAAFLLTNPYLPFSLDVLILEWHDHGADAFGRSVFAAPGAADLLRAFLGFFPAAWGPLPYVGVVWGAVVLAWRREQRVLLAAFLTVLAALLSRRGHAPEDFSHMRFALLLVPVGAVWAAGAAARLARERPWTWPILGAAALALQFPLAAAYTANFVAAAGNGATTLSAGEILRAEIPPGARVAFDALPHPADTPVVDPFRWETRFAPGALARPEEVDFWVVSETCPAAWRAAIERDFRPWRRVAKPQPPLPTFPFRDRFAMANRDFVIYRRR